jgi:hypothetical protein
MDTLVISLIGFTILAIGYFALSRPSSVNVVLQPTPEEIPKPIVIIDQPKPAIEPPKPIVIIDQPKPVVIIDQPAQQVSPPLTSAPEVAVTVSFYQTLQDLLPKGFLSTNPTGPRSLATIIGANRKYTYEPGSFYTMNDGSLRGANTSVSSLQSTVGECIQACDSIKCDMYAYAPSNGACYANSGSYPDVTVDNTDIISGQAIN